MARVTEEKDYYINISQENISILKDYLDDTEIIGLTKTTIDNYRSCLKEFALFIQKNLEEIDINDLKNFKRYLEKEKKNKYGENLKPKTVDRYFSAIQSLLEFLEYEGHIISNPMKSFRKRYLRDYRKMKNSGKWKRQLISVEQMSKLVNSIMEPRDKAVVLLLAKTGIRRNELVNIDIDDIDWVDQSILLKPTPKRTNPVVFFDDETARVLKRWMISRENWNENGDTALFVNERGGRLNRNGIYELVTKHAERIGLHDRKSRKLKDRFTTHCTRHWFSTQLRRSGMPREHRMELRGDSRSQGIDHYEPIDRLELKESYLAHIPQLGID